MKLTYAAKMWMFVLLMQLFSAVWTLVIIGIMELCK